MHVCTGPTGAKLPVLWGWGKVRVIIGEIEKMQETDMGGLQGNLPDASAVLIDAPPVTVPCLSRPGNLPTDPDLP